jgi:flagellar hook assembly protein FlgD
LVTGTQSSGVHQIVWDARNDQGVTVPSGIYIYQLKAGNFTQSRKMMLVK